MRFAIFGDIHANLEALRAVLEDADDQQCTHYVCLGDVVGYNANPHDCLELVRDLECPVVQGNHDEQASSEKELTGFNALAEEALSWTRDQLSGDDKKWLRELRLVRQVRDFTIVHATLDAPHSWGYVFTHLDAAASFNYQHTALCFYGHTHAPQVFVRDSGIHCHLYENLAIEHGKKYFINVGSVGQPRDGDWHARYAIYDVGEHCVELRRIDYDLKTAQAKIRDAGLPEILAERLALGK